MKIYEGKLVSKEMKIGIVCARFNEFIVGKLLEGALDGLKRHDTTENFRIAAFAMNSIFFDVKSEHIPIRV